LEQIYQEYLPDTLKIFAIDPLDELSDIQLTRNELGLTFNLLRGKGSKVATDYHITDYPTTLIVDRTGKVHYYKEGFSGGSDLARIRQELNQLF